MRKPLVLLLLLLALALPAQALVVREVVWGFDGRCAPQRLNPVSILLDNSGATPYDGEIVLQKLDGIGRRIGEQSVEPLYLAPFTTRWVQFQAYVARSEETWLLQWGPDPQQQAALPATRIGPPARVLLDDPEERERSVCEIRRFPANLLPTSVAGMDALHSVVLDRAPRWEPARKEAFMDWLHAGGEVHILQGEHGGGWPEFPPDMSALNGGDALARVGAGRVARHSITREQVSDAWLAQQGYPAPELILEKALGDACEDIVFRRLNALVRPKRHWVLIYGMSVLYIALIGPVSLLMGRRLKDYRWTILLLLGLVTVFGLSFSLLARESSGASSRAFTLSYARPAAPGAWDVTQWSRTFVTRSGSYTIAHPCPHNIYATCQSFEPVEGIALNGKDGRFMANMRLNSSGTLLHRGKFSGPDLQARVIRWQGKETLDGFALEVHPPGGILDALAYYRGRCVTLNATASDRLELTESHSAFDVSTKLRSTSAALMDAEEENVADALETFRALQYSVIGRAVGVPVDGEPADPAKAPGPEEIHVFILSPAPDGFGMTEGSLKRETGCVVYHLRFFRTEFTDGGM